MKILLSGANGRMGRQVAEVCRAQGIPVRAGVDLKAESSGAFPVYPSFSALSPDPEDLVIDFSLPAGLDELLAWCTANRVPCVLATTGYDEAALEKIRTASRLIPVFRSANMSLGVHVLKLLSAMASEMLADFDIEIIEKHHRQKVDAPSGTALLLYDAVKREDSCPVYDRHALHGKREKRQIGIASVRGGTVPGVHEVGFYGPSETVLLTHSAQDRAVFASGALKAAQWLDGKRGGNGLYGMDDMLHL